MPVLPRIRTAMMSAVFAASFSVAAQADGFVNPDVLILGDSQISFGSGPAFLKFFANIERSCNPTRKQAQDLKQLGDMHVGVIGVRSTSLHSWTARSGRPKDTICEEDQKWHVNAGSYGVINQTDNKYVQIGKGPEYQFCAPNKSAFEHMFRKNYYDPKLLLMTFLGNSTERWAASEQNAIKDVRRMMSQLPKDLPCIFMTTAPAYKQDTIDMRLKAQDNLMSAFEKTGNHCSFVEGTTPATIAANLGNKSHFRLNANGSVKDPFHPNEKAANAFFELEMDNICSAVFTQLSGKS